MASFWDKYEQPTQGAQPPQNQQGQGQAMPDPFGGPQEMTRQFNQFLGNYRGKNPQEEARKMLQNAPAWQRNIIERLVPACLPFVQGGGRR